MSVELQKYSSENAFIKKIMKYPTLSKEEEQEEVLKYKTNNDLKSAEKIIMSHMKFVYAASRAFEGFGVPRMDLVQEGAIALISALDSFDPSKNFRFYSLAVQYVRYAFIELTSKFYKQAKFVISKNEKKIFFNLGKNVKDRNSITHSEIKKISEELGIPFEEVSTYISSLISNDVSLDLQYDNETDSVPRYLLEIEDSSANLLPNMLNNEKRKIFLDAFSRLDKRTKEIVSERNLVEVPKTLEELSAAHGISKERIRQIEEKGISTIKKYVKARYL